jgi:hypothetical protein
MTHTFCEKAGIAVFMAFPGKLGALIFTQMDKHSSTRLHKSITSKKRPGYMAGNREEFPAKSTHKNRDSKVKKMTKPD